MCIVTKLSVKNSQKVKSGNSLAVQWLGLYTFKKRYRFNSFMTTHPLPNVTKYFLSFIRQVVLLALLIFIYIENSLVVQCLGLCTFTAEGPDSIPRQGTKISPLLFGFFFISFSFLFLWGDLSARNSQYCLTFEPTFSSLNAHTCPYVSNFIIYFVMS